MLTAGAANLANDHGWFLATGSHTVLIGYTVTQRRRPVTGFTSETLRIEAGAARLTELHVEFVLVFDFVFKLQRNSDGTFSARICLEDSGLHVFSSNSSPLNLHIVTIVLIVTLMTLMLFESA